MLVMAPGCGPGRREFDSHPALMSSFGELITCRHCMAQVHKNTVIKDNGRCPICLRTLTFPGLNHIRRRKTGKGKAAKAQQARLAKLGHRDDWTCHLCGLPVGMESATVDHLVPKAQGGTRAWWNIALAHWECNNIRGDRPVEEGRVHVRKVLGISGS